VKTWSVSLLAAAALAFSVLPALADDPVVAKVDGVDIKQSDLDFAASEVGPRISNYSADDRRRVLLQYVIENELMAAAGDKDKLDEGAAFESRVKYHQRQALRDAFFDAKIRESVSEDEAKKVYEERVKQVKPEQELHARHILVATEAEAKDVAARLKKGEDFATVAKEKSKDVNAQGGDLGFFGKGQMVKPFEDAAFALEVGAISEPVQTPFGWHIIKIEEKRDRQLPSFDQVKEAIMAQLVQQKAQAIVTGLRDTAKIEILDPTIKKSMEDAQFRGEVPPDQTEAPSGDVEDNH
jgi:peptidyl-prolyl cis-trans isomerase C